MKKTIVFIILASLFLAITSCTNTMNTTSSNSSNASSGDKASDNAKAEYTLKDYPVITCVQVLGPSTILVFFNTAVKFKGDPAEILQISSPTGYIGSLNYKIWMVEKMDDMTYKVHFTGCLVDSFCVSVTDNEQNPKDAIINRLVNKANGAPMVANYPYTATRDYVTFATDQYLFRFTVPQQLMLIRADKIDNKRVAFEFNMPVKFLVDPKTVVFYCGLMTPDSPGAGAEINVKEVTKINDYRYEATLSEEIIDPFGEIRIIENIGTDKNGSLGGIVTDVSGMYALCGRIAGDEKAYDIAGIPITMSK